MKMKGVWSLVAAKVGIIGAAYLAYANADSIKEVDYAFFHRGQEIGYDFFQDPSGLRNDVRINSQGIVEVYNVHDKSGSEVEVLRDLMPSTSSIVAGLTERYSQGWGDDGDYAADFLRLAKAEISQGLAKGEVEALRQEVRSLYELLVSKE